jgi:hypothetical protein
MTLFAPITAAIEKLADDLAIPAEDLRNKILGA